MSTFVGSKACSPGPAPSQDVRVESRAGVRGALPLLCGCLCARRVPARWSHRSSPASDATQPPARNTLCRPRLSLRFQMRSSSSGACTLLPRGRALFFLRGVHSSSSGACTLLPRGRLLPALPPPVRAQDLDVSSPRCHDGIVGLRRLCLLTTEAMPVSSPSALPGTVRATKHNIVNICRMKQ